MRKLAFAAATALTFMPVLAHAENPIVVELFTSQGCSSCPPADLVLEHVAEYGNVIALALHVDYWDYLGWKDAFAKSAFSDRQRRYARAWSERSVYTPQMVVQGSAYMVGSRGDAVQRQIMEREEDQVTVDLVTQIGDATATITISPAGQNVAASSVYLVGYSDGEDVLIERGENRGRTLHYVNVVESWETIANWDGQSDLVLRTQNLDGLHYVVIVQEAGQGPILAAARLTD